MKNIITKKELLAFAKPGRIEEAELALRCLNDHFDYVVSDYSYGSALYDETIISMKLNDGLSAPKAIELNSSIFCVGALHAALLQEAKDLTKVRVIDCPKLIWSAEWPTTTSSDTTNNIESIQYNEKKRITTVVFGDGDVQMAKLGKDDEYDPCIGVAICIAAHQFGSKTSFKKYVNQNLKVKGVKK